MTQLVRRLEENPNAIIAHSDVETFYLDGGLELNVYDRLEGLTSPVERAKRIFSRNGHWWVANRGVFRARAARQIGGMKRKTPRIVAAT